MPEGLHHRPTWGTKRRERAVFRLGQDQVPPARCRAWRIVRVASRKSMSFQRKSSSSPFRRAYCRPVRPTRWATGQWYPPGLMRMGS